MKLWSANVLATIAAISLLLAVTSGQPKAKPNNGKKRLRENVARRDKNTANSKKANVKKAPAAAGSQLNKKATAPALEGCEEIFLPMCKGLVPYTHTKLPNQFNHSTQLEVYRHMEHLWAYMDHSCSRNLRLVACSLYLPKCQGKQPPLGPCKATCVRAKKKCAQPLKDYMALDWDKKFDCTTLPNKRCLKAVKDEECIDEYPTCASNSNIKVCTGLSISQGALPNMFGQCKVDEINMETSQFEKLIATNCHSGLKFLLCGVYSPFCVRNAATDIPFTFPCKEICEEVRKSCEPHYRKLYHQLPWPNKLQCHRYPSAASSDTTCVMPTDPMTF
ncbi:atrial natriuretic peptide-converting enzyme-like [Biomphalaria glabrata]|uniref:Atrial natriuretic peptide-converting enzyme-like n=1 Tax=Biomphalaria glabrata TaxID=6526 RepID=A0A9W2ZCH9_BIOGL|nr:atrial natriuretic peptide-converting enzyme-like [Biomphalaria glabrata]KAI8751827.1 frizzled-5-like; partial [Biomphalaria glabrata]